MSLQCQVLEHPVYNWCGLEQNEPYDKSVQPSDLLEVKIYKLCNPVKTSLKSIKPCKVQQYVFKLTTTS